MLSNQSKTTKIEKLKEREDDFDRIHVCVRIRPLLSSELLAKRQDVTLILSDNQMQIGNHHAFQFDYIFKNSSQAFVYNTMVSPLVNSIFSGYNVTIFAYGQTGSGKTYSMDNTSQLPTPETLVDRSNDQDIDSYYSHVGIVPRILSHIFSEIETQNSSNNLNPPIIEVTASYVEIYNEIFRDLFHPETDRHQIQIRETPSGTTFLTGIYTPQVSSIEEIYQLLAIGNRVRSTAVTEMSQYSSRSHSIFTLYINQKIPHTSHDNPTSTPQYRYLSSKCHLVDLAGSERQKRTHATGQRLTEAIHINKGLLNLGNVISALGADKGSKLRKFIPYRNSKLTRLLQDSLGGNSQTVMVACISPSDKDMMESISTLKYANRAKSIHNVPIVNINISDQIKIKNMQKEIDSLHTQIKDLTDNPSPSTLPVLLPSSYDERQYLYECLVKIVGFITDLRQSESQKEQLREKILQNKNLYQQPNMSASATSIVSDISSLQQQYIETKQHITVLKNDLDQITMKLEKELNGLNIQYHNNILIPPNNQTFDINNNILNNRNLHQNLTKSRIFVASSMSTIPSTDRDNNIISSSDNNNFQKEENFQNSIENNYQQKEENFQKSSEIITSFDPNIIHPIIEIPRLRNITRQEARQREEEEDCVQFQFDVDHEISYPSTITTPRDKENLHSHPNKTPPLIQSLSNENSVPSYQTLTTHHPLSYSMLTIGDQAKVVEYQQQQSLLDKNQDKALLLSEKMSSYLQKQDLQNLKQLHIQNFEENQEKIHYKLQNITQQIEDVETDIKKLKTTSVSHSNSTSLNDQSNIERLEEHHQYLTNLINELKKQSQQNQDDHQYIMKQIDQDIKRLEHICSQLDQQEEQRDVFRVNFEKDNKGKPFIRPSTSYQLKSKPFILPQISLLSSSLSFQTKQEQFENIMQKILQQKEIFALKERQNTEQKELLGQLILEKKELETSFHHQNATEHDIFIKKEQKTDKIENIIETDPYQPINQQQTAAYDDSLSLEEEQALSDLNERIQILQHTISLDQKDQNQNQEDDKETNNPQQLIQQATSIIQPENHDEIEDMTKHYLDLNIRFKEIEKEQLEERRVFQLQNQEKDQKIQTSQQLIQQIQQENENSIHRLHQHYHQKLVELSGHMHNDNINAVTHHYEQIIHYKDEMIDQYQQDLTYYQHNHHLLKNQLKDLLKQAAFEREKNQQFKEKAKINNS